MKKILIHSASAALAAALSIGGAYAQTTDASGTPGGPAGAGSSVTGGAAAPMVQSGTGTRDSRPPDASKLSRADRRFLLDAAGSGMFEVQVSKLAVVKATDPSVKGFAQMLVEHHSAANNALFQIASARRVELPAAPPRALRRKTEQIGRRTGTEFDQAYVREVGIDAHEKDVRAFEKAGKDVKDPELQAWFNNTLPVLQQHLEQAKRLPQAGN